MQPATAQVRNTTEEVTPDRQQKSPRAITVHVASGHLFTGEIDSRTDRSQLWLRWQRGSAVLRRPIRWDRVVRARVAGEDLSGEELRQIVAAVKADAFPGSETGAVKQRRVIGGSAGPPRPAPAADITPGEPRGRPRVRSLAMDAMLANWDADVEVDGLLLHVYPLDAEGVLVPVRGRLEIDLWGHRLGVVKHPRTFRGLGRWTRTVRFEDFGPAKAVYRLPFQGLHPEFDLELAPHGAVHARLSVPGHGTFEASEGMVRIRPYSAVRDQLQHATGRRFFPLERTGDGRR